MKLADWVIDYSYRFTALKAWRHKPPAHYHQHIKEGRIPVILLAGLSMNWHFMRHLGDLISLLGHPVYAIPGLKRNHLDVPSSAKFVRGLIDRHGLTNVVIVGHSKGGIIAKYLLVHLNHDGAVKKTIAIATPFSGSRLARIVPRRSFREMTPESQVIEQLSQNTSTNARIISIMPEIDNHLRESSRLEGAQNIIVKARGHHKVLFDKEVERTVLEILDKESQ